MYAGYERLKGSDEVDLFQLLARVWGQRLWIVAATVLVGSVFLVNALIARPLFEGVVHVRPPLLSDIAPLNRSSAGGSGLVPFAVQDAYEVFLRNLRSESVRRAFFLEVYLPGLPGRPPGSSDADLYDQFRKSLVLAMPRSSFDPLTIKMRVADPELAASWVARFAHMAGEYAEREIIESLGPQVKPAEIAVYRQDGVVESPGKPVGSKTVILTVAGAVAGFVFAFGVALLRSLASMMRGPVAVCGKARD